MNDGPYVFIEDDALIEKRIIKGRVVTERLALDAYRTDFETDPCQFEHIDTIAVLSDIHGQYDLAVELLTNNSIIDQERNWNFGKGHLVIVGDIFDRGDQVNEALWLIYDLEQQASEIGGGVHFTLGNHEYMVLMNDLRYVHKKYKETCELLDLDYPKLYGPNTVMGRWLRSKNTVIRINGNTYVHGGISKKFLDLTNITNEEVNAIMRKSIDRNKAELKITNNYKAFFGTNGPIWYRGYFKDELSYKQVDQILDRLDSDHMVVGHCSNKTIVHLYDHRIYGVDSSIKDGVYGELLLIAGDQYFRCTLDGKREDIPAYKFD